MKNRVPFLVLSGLCLGSACLGRPSMGVAPAPVAVTEHAGLARVVDVARGQRVRVEGIVVRVLDRDEFRLSDGTGSVTVRLPWSGPALVETGARVTVEGIVDDEVTFGLSRPEIFAVSIELPDGATMRFTEPRAPAIDARSVDEGPHDPAAQTPIAALVPGRPATIGGVVVAVLDTDEFRLRDESGSVRVYIGWRNTMPVGVGDRVAISGVLDDDSLPLKPEFYADTIALGDGRVVGLRRGTNEGANDSISAWTAPASPAGRPAARTPIANLRPYDVALIEGVVERITDDDEFRIRDDSGSVRVYIGWRNRMPVAQGDRVAVLGIVDASGPSGLFREVYAYELTDAEGRVIELQPARVSRAGAPVGERAVDAARPATTTVSIASVRRGQSVTLQGEVARIRDTDEFVLRDDTGTIRIYIGWRNRMPVVVGDRITVIGVADDDVFPWMRPEIYADRIVLADGRSITLVRGGYDY